MSTDKYLECGKIINTHGLDGGMKVESWCDSPNILAELEHVFMLDGEEFVEKKVNRASVFKHLVLFWLDGIDNVDTVEGLKNTVIYARRDEIEIDEDSHFIADLLGLSVIDDKSGEVYGELCNIFNAGASDIYVVKTKNGEKMIPAVSEFVKRIDENLGIYITPIEGMFD